MIGISGLRDSVPRKTLNTLPFEIRKWKIPKKNTKNTKKKLKIQTNTEDEKPEKVSCFISPI